PRCRTAGPRLRDESEEVEAQLRRMKMARECGKCSLCCKVFKFSKSELFPFDKPRGEWCRHCEVGKGCSIYETRPELCSDFKCLWLMEKLPEYWYPLKSKMVFSHSYVNRKTIVCDVPGVWRQEPYYSDIKKWLKEGVYIEIREPKSCKFLLPNLREAELPF